MAGDPADVRGAPINVALTQVENVFRGRMNTDEIASGSVQNSLWFPGRTTGVENVERMFTVERGRRTFGVNIFQLPVPPDVAAFLDVHLVSCPPKHNHSFNRSSSTQGFIDILFQGHNRAPAVRTVGRDDGNRAAIRDSVTNAVRAKSAEND